MIAAAVTEAIALLREEPWRQSTVRAMAREVRASIEKMGVAVPAGDAPIIPVIVGDEQRALAISGRLAEARLLVPAVRPPSVPRGGSRLRITLCCEHTPDELRRLVDALGEAVSRCEGR
jgi:8-amino-7-oxononanoate synthase